MATIIPSISSPLTQMTPGERRFAARLEDKLENDYLCWYDIPIGGGKHHPDFVILHPGRGLLVLELKDWKLETIRSMNKQYATIVTNDGEKSVRNPIEQARQHLHGIKETLEHDAQLVHASGPYTGRLTFPYGQGVVFCNITRKQFNSTDLGEVLPADLVICQDEMTESVDSEAFQKRLWGMLPRSFHGQLTVPQIDRIRWLLYPEVRIGAQRELFSGEEHDSIEIPDVVRVMDLQQEQLARSLGEGHRVIHGVAGSGKTMILGYRAEHLAKICRRPLLVLCYNKTLAARLAAVMEQKGLDGKVSAVNFHAWCVRQLVTYHVGMPPEDLDRDRYFEDCVDRVIRAVEQGRIPTAQYDAVLIDEGHDFKPEWFKLVVQMIDPRSNSLLLLYDDAQSIYKGRKKKGFSFSSVGIQAKGRTTILKLNYRNTSEILEVAKAFADDLFSATDAGEDVAPAVQPMGVGRHGPKPLLIELPSLKAESNLIVDRLVAAHNGGMAWSDMAVIYRRFPIVREIANILERRRIPFWQQGRHGKFSRAGDTVKLLTMHSSKGLEFPFVCIPDIGIGGVKVDLQEEARLLYVGMTRATYELLMTYSRASILVDKMRRAMDTL